MTPEEVPPISKSAIYDYDLCPFLYWGRRVTKEYSPPATEAMVLGIFFHAHILEPHKLPELEDEWDEMIHMKNRKTPTLKKAFSEDLGRLVDAVKAQKMIMGYLESCNREVWVQGEVEGIKFHGRVDALDNQRMFFLDFKTIAAFRGELAWKWTWDEIEKKREKWPWYWTSLGQLALYQALLKGFKKIIPMIPAVSKQDPPDVGLFAFTTQDLLDQQLEKLMVTARKIVIDRVAGEPSRRCGICEWCRMNNMITEPVQI